MKPSARSPWILAATVTLLTLCRTARAQSAGLEGSTWFAAPSGPTRDKASSDSDGARDSRRVDHLRLGVLGSAGFPRPLAIEGLLKLERTVALGVEYSALPQMTISSVHTSFWAVAGDARVFPFRGPFFFGLRAGHQHLGADTSIAITGYGTLPASVTVDTLFINPRVGFLWTWEPGISLGINAGIQIPLSSTTTDSLPTTSVSVVKNAKSQLNQVAGSLGQTTLPTVDLIQLGILL